MDRVGVFILKMAISYVLYDLCGIDQLHIDGLLIGNRVKNQEGLLTLKLILCKRSQTFVTSS